jgi:hypothetical protein
VSCTSPGSVSATGQAGEVKVVRIETSAASPIAIS